MMGIVDLIRSAVGLDVAPHDLEDDEPEQTALDRWAERQVDHDVRSGELEMPAYLRRVPRVRALEWTVARPGKPGFYAQRPFGTEQSCSIVEVVEGPDGALWWAWGPREPAVRVDDDRTFGRFEWGTFPYQVPA